MFVGSKRLERQGGREETVRRWWLKLTIGHITELMAISAIPEHAVITVTLLYKQN
jgi:hypothetical protein